VLDGLEITVVSAVAGIFSEETTLGLSSTAIGAIAIVYLAGEVVGGVFFGRLSDTIGPRKENWGRTQPPGEPCPAVRSGR
jgi:MFS family permease